jgi:hypothetical protein
MCIGPQYRINRLIKDLVAEKESLRATLKRARSVSKIAQLCTAIDTLDWAIKRVRLHAAGKAPA